MDQIQHVMKLLTKGEKGLAQKAYQKMRDDCLVVSGRKTGDEKVGILAAACSANVAICRVILAELDPTPVVDVLKNSTSKYSGRRKERA